MLCLHNALSCIKLQIFSTKSRLNIISRTIPKYPVFQLIFIVKISFVKVLGAKNRFDC